MITEFRGFRDFGMIGSIGMVLCWLGTYLTLPSILTVIERISPIKGRAPGSPPSSKQVGFVARVRRLTRAGVAFGRPFAWLAPLAPRAVATGGALLAVVGLVLTVAYVRGDPMEYDLRKLRTAETARSEQSRITTLAEDVTGYVGAKGMAILVDRVDQVAPLTAELERRRDAAPVGKKPFKAVHALQDFVPKDQAEKIPILLAIKARVLRARKLGMVTDQDWKQIERTLPPDDLEALRPRGSALPAWRTRSPRRTAPAGASSTSSPPPTTAPRTRTTCSAGPTPTARPGSPTAASSTAPGAR